MNLHRVDDFENPEFKILLRHQDQKFKNLENPNPESIARKQKYKI